MSKLSERFKKQVVIEYEEPQIEAVESEYGELADRLLEKVNSVPYWNEYTPQQQREMVGYFVKNSASEDKDIECDTLSSYVIGFGPLQKFLDNEKVSAVFIKNVNSVLIEIGGREFDTEIKLSKNMFKYVLNYVKYLQIEAPDLCYRIDFDEADITIRK